MEKLLSFEDSDAVVKEIKEEVPLAEVVQPEASGKCGVNLTWELQEETLVITGSGAMDDYSTKFSVPWANWNLGIKKLKLAPEVTTIGDHAFQGCKALAEIKFSPELTKIGDFAFKKCVALKELIIPDSVTSIGDSAFAECRALKALILPEKLKEIGNSAFEECKALKNLIIPEEVTTIGDSAFEECQALKALIIPEGVISIGDSAFEECEALSSLVLPAGVLNIGDSAFEECQALQFVFFAGAAPANWGEKVFEDGAKGFKIYYLEGQEGWTTPAWNGYRTIPLPKTK